MNTRWKGIAIEGRDILFFALRFLAISAALYILYYFFAGTYYVRLLALAAGPLLSIFGHAFILENALNVAEEIALNPLVFVSLVIAVDRISWRVKLRAAVIGMAILVVLNAFTVTFAFVGNYRQSEGWWRGAEILGLLNNFFVPILLWLALLPLGEAFRHRRGPGGSGA